VWLKRVLEVYPRAVWLNPEPEEIWPYRQSIAYSGKSWEDACIRPPSRDWSAPCALWSNSDANVAAAGLLLALAVFAIDAGAARVGKKQLWGSIAYNTKTGSYGFAVDRATKRDAETEAFRLCGANCNLVRSFPTAAAPSRPGRTASPRTRAPRARSRKPKRSENAGQLQDRRVGVHFREIGARRRLAVPSLERRGGAKRRVV